MDLLKLRARSIMAAKKPANVLKASELILFSHLDDGLNPNLVAPNQSMTSYSGSHDFNIKRFPQLYSSFYNTSSFSYYRTSAYDIATVQRTYELWLYLIPDTVTGIPVGIGVNSDQNSIQFASRSDSGKMYGIFLTQGNAFPGEVEWEIPVNTWFHIAITLHGDGTTSCFYNGIMKVNKQVPVFTPPWDAILPDYLLFCVTLQSRKNELVIYNYAKYTKDFIPLDIPYVLE